MSASSTFTKVSISNNSSFNTWPIMQDLTYRTSNSWLQSLIFESNLKAKPIIFSMVRDSKKLFA